MLWNNKIDPYEIRSTKHIHFRVLHGKTPRACPSPHSMHEQDCGGKKGERGGSGAACALWSEAELERQQQWGAGWCEQPPLLSEPWWYPDPCCRWGSSMEPWSCCILLQPGLCWCLWTMLLMKAMWIPVDWAASWSYVHNWGPTMLPPWTMMIWVTALPSDAKVTSGSAATKGYVCFHGSTAAKICVGIYGPHYHWRPCGCLWSGLLSKAMSMSMGRTVPRNHIDMRGKCCHLGQGCCLWSSLPPRA